MSTIPNKKRIAIIGGGTNTYISNHLALSAPAYGATAENLQHKFRSHPDNQMMVNLYLTKMARPDWEDAPDTPEEVEALVDRLVGDPNTRVIIFNVAMVDFKPTYLQEWRTEDKTLGEDSDTFGKYNGRISTSGTSVIDLELKPYDKIINKIRKERKDILLVGFKTTCGSTKEDQFQKGLKLCKDASANIVFVNDVDKNRIKDLNRYIEEFSKIENSDTFHHLLSHEKDNTLTKESFELLRTYRGSLDSINHFILKLQNNGLVTPEESSYWYNTRDEALDGLVQMVLDRSHLHFTRSTVVDSETVSWSIPTLKVAPKHYVKIVDGTDISKGEVIHMPNPIIPETFRVVFDWVRSQGAYKKGPTGATVGHFGIKLGPNEFLTSKRKTDFNKIEEVGLVRVITDDPDDVFGYKHFFISEEESKVIDILKQLHVELDLCKKQSNTQSNQASLQGQIGFYKSKLKFLETQRDSKVIAFGAKPSVGGQSQRSLFQAFPDLNCIIHFHCPLRPESRKLFTTTPQFSYECGSLQCVTSNLTGFKEYKVSETHSIWAGHMDHHGPNIVFNSDINPQLVINFINTFWDLSRKTDGLSEENK